ncbi:Glycosyltransferase, GT2 family [Cruoricaptor ignavus]|uniref:Glycosyltransferase, GT2 family n=1 Tax=Cruoricaptor ignavus TaxID=1118202 RepID=A0A1M6CB66_9FLAO|nr:glycosyltransferase family 2 protein [Cruoricaptor ignavus]SHI58249.1 Glycosyltransferase, GT2 family [Cruoricaptor ignavus]
MKLAIAILSWKGKHYLEKFLPGVIEHSSGAEVCVIDNASDDGTAKFLEKNFPGIRHIQLDKNYGFAEGYNLGLKQIDAEIFCLLNNDVEVTPGWVEPVLNLFKQNEKIAAIQPKILDFNNRKKFEFAGAAGGFIDKFAYPYCRGRIFNKTETDRGQYDDDAEIFWASGCAMFIRSKDFFEQEGFDERFFAHQEEIDLCWRLKNSGRKIFYCGHSTVYHLGAGTLSKQNPQKTFLNFRNNLSMMLKNLAFPQLIPLIFIRLCLDGMAGIFFLFTLGFAHTWAIVRAHLAFYAAAPETWRRRGKHQIKNYYEEKVILKKIF